MCEPHYVNLFVLWTSSIVYLFVWTFRWFKFNLNPLIGSWSAISFGQFGTLPIDIFLSNLVWRQLETSPRASWGPFWHMSIFGDSRAIRVLWPKTGVFRKSMFTPWRSDGASKWLGGLGGQVPRLYGGTIFGGGVTPSGHLAGIRVQRFRFLNLCRIFLTPQMWGFWPINWHRCVTTCNLE